MSKTRQPTRQSGPFVSGETPLPFTVKFDPTHVLVIGTTTSVTWADDTIGLVQVEFDSADLLLGAGVEHEDRVLMVWTGDGTNLVATVRIKVPIDAAVGTPPAI